MLPSRAYDLSGRPDVESKVNYSAVATSSEGYIPSTPKVNNKLAMDELKVTENIVLLTLKQFNISKLPGPDDIGAILLMELSENICHPLRKIFETSIKTSIILDDWKDAKISAIYIER